MPYDSTGAWKPEDDSATTKLNGFLASDSPVMQSAATGAAQAANARGLQNSSIAIGAGQKAVIDSAAPFVLNDSQNTAAKNLSAQGFGQSTQLQGQQIQSTEKIAGEQIKSQQDQLAQQLGSNERLQLAQLAAQKELTGMTLTSEEQRDANELKAATDRLNLQNASSETIASQGVAANKQAVAVGEIDKINAIYQDAVNQITGNANIPADTRSALLTNAAAQRDSNLRIIQQIYGVSFTWDSAATTPAGGGTPTTPAGGGGGTGPAGGNYVAPSGGTTGNGPYQAVP